MLEIVDPGDSLLNRRAFFRQPMYKDVELRAPGMHSGFPSTLVDLSGGGCLVATRKMFKPRTKVELDLPTTPDQSIQLKGHIAKVRYTPTDRTFHYGIAFDEIEDRERETLLHYIGSEQRRLLEEIRLRRRRNEHHAPSRERRRGPRVSAKFPVTYSVSGVPTSFTAHALDIGAGGIRVFTDRILRSEWALELRFQLPNDTMRMAHQVAAKVVNDARPFAPIRIPCRPLPGVLRVRDGYVQRISFIGAPAEITAELQRFVRVALAVEQ